MTALMVGVNAGAVAEVLLGVLLSVSAWLGLSLPFAAAHLEFWGARRGRPEDRETGRILAGAAVCNLIGIAASAAGLLALNLARHPEALLPPLIWMAPVWFWAWLGGAGYAGLVLLVQSEAGWLARRPGLRAACAAAAGGLALFLAAAWGAGAAAIENPSVWPLLPESPWAAFGLRGEVLFAVHHALSAGAAGGVAVMLAGRRAFRWESAVPLSSGARFIRLGAGCLLAAAVLQTALAAGWVIDKGPGWIQLSFYGGGRPLMAAVAALAAGVIFLLEVAVSALRRQGNAPRAGVTAAALLLLVALALGGVRAGLEAAAAQRAAQAAQTKDGAAGREASR